MNIRHSLSSDQRYSASDQVLSWANTIRPMFPGWVRSRFPQPLKRGIDSVVVQCWHSVGDGGQHQATIGLNCDGCLKDILWQCGLIYTEHCAACSNQSVGLIVSPRLRVFWIVEKLFITCTFVTTVMLRQERGYNLLFNYMQWNNRIAINISSFSPEKKRSNGNTF